MKRSDTGASIYEDDPAVFFSGGSADYYLDDTAVDAARAKLAWVTAHAVPGGALLDVGANVGHFTRLAAAQFQAVGIEPNVHAVRWARQHLHAPVEVGSVYDTRPDFAARFDLVTMFDVIEHLPAPAAALAHIREWLADRGQLFITTPDGGSLTARLLGRHWHYIDLDEHIALFTAANLRALLAQSGFTVVAIRTIGRQYRFSYIESRLRHLARDAPLLRAALVAAQPLRLFPRRRVTLNLGDVMGIVAERRS